MSKVISTAISGQEFFLSIPLCSSSLKFDISANGLQLKEAIFLILCWLIESWVDKSLKRPLPINIILMPKGQRKQPVACSEHTFVLKPMAHTCYFK